MSKRPGGGIFAKKQIANANQTVKFNTNSLKLYKSPRMNSTNQMAMRTGGWADPAKMTAERKFVDVSNNFNMTHSVATWSAPILLNGIPSGSGASDRIGRKITLASILVRGSVRLSPTSVGGSPIRILVFYDKQANSAARVSVAPNDVLVIDNFKSPNELSNRDRYVTIFDHITSPISTNGDFSQNVTLYKKLQLEQIFTSGPLGTVAEISTGAVWAVVALTPGISGANAAFDFYSRIRYTDV